MDNFDKILVDNAKVHMIEFDLEKFKKQYTRLYHTIRACIYEASKK